jgi:HPt (histidine-containing phosphotransfer) domain-containing protein
MREQQDLSGLAVFLHTLSGVCGNIGAKELYAVAYPLSHGLKALSQEPNAKLSIPQQKQLEHIELHLHGLVKEITQAIPQESKEESGKEMLSMEIWEVKTRELMQLMSEQDSDAFDYCENWIQQYQLTEEQNSKLLAVKKALSDFEFDQAVDFLKS